MVFDTIDDGPKISTAVTAAAIARYRKKRPNVAVEVLALATRQVIEEVARHM